ncbi:unnamed protein product [Lepeophtheirus salmonis]|uniref:(salmon louse) hypothetical protein n=1 Tax=Lepeophtheirus salmonis TaxID=72036 RepID=A0A7R8CIV4_LEPSM|nr:unnamed protein product [Lepeophtheirus salmonis]CAF2836723.1 unnamed protein product [Lepeophtheirus salmonis]
MKTVLKQLLVSPHIQETLVAQPLLLATSVELTSTVTVNPWGGDENIINRSPDISKDRGASKDCYVSRGRGVLGYRDVSKNTEVSNSSEDGKNQNNENKLIRSSKDVSGIGDKGNAITQGRKKLSSTLL